MRLFPPARPIVAVECWTWYTFALLVVILRFTSQHTVHGKNIFQKSRSDDLIMVLAVCTYTIGIACLYIYDGISSSLDYDTLSATEAAHYGRQLGIINILAETSIQTTLWSVKANILVLNYRLTQNSKYHFIVVAVSVYTVLAYVGILITLYAGFCRPFSQYLVLTPVVEQCLTWIHYNTVQLVLNVSSDLMIFIIPLSVVLRTKIEFKKKVLVTGIFGLGLFVIVAAIAQKVAVYLEPTQPVWLLWSIREISTAMLIGNLVFCQPLIRKLDDYITNSTFSSSWYSKLHRSSNRTDPEPAATGEKDDEKSDKGSCEKVISVTTTATGSIV